MYYCGIIIYYYCSLGYIMDYYILYIVWYILSISIYLLGIMGILGNIHIIDYSIEKITV